MLNTKGENKMTFLILICLFFSLLLFPCIAFAAVSPVNEDGSPRLCRITQRKWIGGVCAGFAYKLGIPLWVTRLIPVATVIFFGFGILAYILLWIFMPEAEIEPEDFDKRVEIR